MSKATVVKKAPSAETPTPVTGLTGKEAQAQKAQERWANYTPEEREAMLAKMKAGRDKTPEQRKQELLEQKARWTAEHNERIARIDASLKRLENQGEVNIEALLEKAKTDFDSLTPTELGRLQNYKRKQQAEAAQTTAQVEGQEGEAGEAS